LILLAQHQGLLGLGLNFVMVQTVFAVEGHLQVVDQPLALVADLAGQVAMDCLADRPDFDLDLGLGDLLPDPSVLVVLVVLGDLLPAPLGLVSQVQD
jgi:hypothetical protein